jgi:hypothetical protein
MQYQSLVPLYGEQIFAPFAKSWKVILSCSKMVSEGANLKCKK